MATPVLDETLPRSPWPYARVHATACVAVLRRWLGRWAVFTAVAALVASAGAGLDTALATVAALAAWTALPLARGAAAGGGWLPLAVLGSAAVGWALLVTMRHALWPAAWREAERALPLAPRQTRSSDLRVVAMAALPWALLQAAGMAVWLLQRPAWLVGHEAALLAAGVVAGLLTLGGGLALQRARRRGAPWWRKPGVDTDQPPAATPPLRLRRTGLPAWVLLGWPLVRGVAPRSAQHAGLTLAAAALVAAAAAWRPAWTGLWLALQALIVQVAVSRARGLAALELHPLGRACAALPIAPWRWRAGLDLTCAAPALLGAAAVAAVVMGCAASLRVPVLLGWWAWLGLSATLDLRVPTADASVQAARWLFLLVVAVALGSEVLA
jgi:hypothetical protein